MNITVATLFLMSLVAALKPDTCLLKLNYKAYPDDVHLRISVTSGSRAFTCEPLGATTCVADIIHDSRVVTVTIKAAGYRVYRRTFLDIICRKDVGAPLSLGDIRLTESDLPRIVQILEEHDSAGNTQFQLVLSNRSKRRTLLKQVAVVAARPFESSGMCSSPSPNYFAISGKLQIVAVDQRAASIAGHFRHANETRYVADMQGFVDHDGCEARDRLVLILPAAIDLPPSEFTTITLVIPPRFELLPPKEWQQMAGDEVWLKQLITDIGVLKGFRNFTFALTSDDPDAAEIVGTK
jgi:hypothetical protein